MMKKGLMKEALIKIAAGFVLVCLLLFVPAGTFRWSNGWLFIAILFIPMFIAGIVMYYKDPALLRSRLNAKEKEKEQKDVIGYSGIMFMAAFIVAGLNHRFGWTKLPETVIIAACVVFLLSYLMFAEVLRENSFLSRTIEVQEEQTVVDTGLYGIIRHPMYTATVFLFLCMPLIMDSLPSFLIMLVYIPLIIKRIRNEEEVLEKELKGYREYKEKVKYRLLPYIW